MTPFVDDPDFTLHVGDALETLRLLPDGSVDCVATSPPFYALRDYGTGTWSGGDAEHEHDRIGARGGRGGSGTLDKRSADAMPSTLPARSCSCGATYSDPQIGLEDTPEEWATSLVAVFAECRRVLTSTGTLWVECGDSYVSGQGGRQSAVGELPPSTRFDRKEAGEKRPELPSSFGERDVGPRFYPGRDTGLKPKDLLGSPWLLAFALRADGWWLRQAIVWHKPNAMPESATDRCTTAHSYVFLLSKSARYHFDAEAIAEPAEWARWGDQTTPKYEGTDTASGWMQPKSKRELMALSDHRYDGLVGQKWKKDGRDGNGQRPRTEDMRGFDERRDRADGLKNPRSVWTIPTQGYPEAHFATWPEKLVERIILAGCPQHVCATCGKPRERQVEKSTTPTQRVHNGNYDASSGRGKSGWLPGVQDRETVGWSDCGHDNLRPGVILDPFMGSGTTALVARKHGRKSVGIELNESYAALAARRLGQQSLLAEGAA